MSSIVNELLCSMKCYFGKYPKTELINVFSDFYSDSEISDAKSMIFDVADKIVPKIEELNNIKPRVGDGKARRSVEDIVNI